MTESTIPELHQARIDALRSQIHHHNDRYYNQSAPEISDATYDQLFQELLALEAKYPQIADSRSPTQTVGATPSPRKRLWQHATPMLSLSNVFSRTELAAFDARVAKQLGVEEIEYSCEPKIDGLAVSLIYINGILTMGATRGDGMTGEQIVQSLPQLSGAPQRINTPYQQVEIRGEVVMTKQAFAELINASDVHYANPRNAASGKLRMLEGSDCSLSFIGYQMLVSGEQPYKTQLEVLHALKDYGVATHQHLWHACRWQECEIYYTQLIELRESLPYEIDGMVIKVNSLAYQDMLGALSRQPRFACAYKFPAHETTTRLVGVEFQVSRMGTLTPVALLEPVAIGGITVQHATLHNYDEIKRLDISIGDMVSLQRAGDVIPKITGKVSAASQSEPIVPPDICPSCHSDLVFDQVFVRCLNHEQCAQQQIGRYIHFCSKPAMNIQGLGKSIIEKLWHAGLVRSLYDIYRLKKSDLLLLDKMGEVSAQNLLAAIDASRKVSAARFIYALGIQGVGFTLAQKLASEFDSITALCHATRDVLVAIDDIGEVVADNIMLFFANPHRQAELHELLLEIALEHVHVYLDGQKNQFVEGKRFVLTGTLSEPRDAIKHMLRSVGAIVVDSVSKRVDYVVYGKDAGSKLQKAQQLGVHTLNETELKALLSQGNRAV